MFQTVIQAVYSLISQLLCNHGNSVAMNTYLEQVNSSLLNDITNVVEKINFAKVKLWNVSCILVVLYYVVV